MADAPAKPVATFHMELRVISDGSVSVRVECEDVAKETSVEFVDEALAKGFEDLQEEVRRIVHALLEKEKFDEILTRQSVV